MRLPDLCLTALVVAAAACLPVKRLRGLARLLALFAAAATAAELIVEGPYWQLYPVFAAAVVVLAVAWLPRTGTALRVAVAVLVLGLAGGSILCLALLPMFRLPKPTGPYPVGTALLYMRDTSRMEDAGGPPNTPRELMVQLWYPAEASSKPFARYRRRRETDFVSSYQTAIRTNSRLEAPVAQRGAPFPVILLNHAWHGRRTHDTFLAEDLASHGYVVAAIDHTYNAMVVAFPDGRIIAGHPAADIDDPDHSTAARVQAIWNRELVKWTADQRFVLNELERLDRSAGSPWYGRLNTNVAGAVGHSFGGAASTDICDSDRRVRGSVNMDGWSFQAIRDRGPGQPLMMMVAEPANFSRADFAAMVAGRKTPPAASVEDSLDESDMANVLTSMRKYGGYLLVVPGAEHNDFTDQELVSPFSMISFHGTVPAAQMETIVRSYVLAFLDRAVRGEDPALLQGESSPFRHVLFHSWPGGGQAAAAAEKQAAQGAAGGGARRAFPQPYITPSNINESKASNPGQSPG